MKSLLQTQIIKKKCIVIYYEPLMVIAGGFQEVCVGLDILQSSLTGGYDRVTSRNGSVGLGLQLGQVCAGVLDPG